MIHTGLASVTFRKLQPRDVVVLALRSKLEGIEWGGDVHVPHGDVHTARRVRRLCEESGVHIVAYGSYYRAGAATGVPFEAIRDTAAALGAPLIRVWAGKKASAEATESERSLVVDDGRRIAGLAAQAGIAVAFEWHGGTLIDTTESALALLAAVKHANLGCYWQPPRGSTAEENLATLDAIKPWLRNVHVVQLQRETRERQALVDGESTWLPYLRKIAAMPGDRYAMIEFVKDDSPQQCAEDAKTLNWWLSLANR